MIQNQFLAPTFRFANRLIVNNNAAAIAPWRVEEIVPLSLPILVSVWQAIEAVTRHAWKCTSFIRDSPSHQFGHSLDLAPDMANDLRHVYSGTRRSDPILYARPFLMNALLTLKNHVFSPLCDIAIAVESDHLHLQVVKRGSLGPHPTNVLRWQALKPIYPDTQARNAIATDARLSSALN